MERAQMLLIIEVVKALSIFWIREQLFQMRSAGRIPGPWIETLARREDIKKLGNGWAARRGRYNEPAWGPGKKMI